MLKRTHPYIFRDPLSIGSAKNGTLRRLKTVLYWNEFYGRYDTYDFGYGHEAFVEKQCAVSGCFATKVWLYSNQLLNNKTLY